jgi:hypothetical protein
MRSQRFVSPRFPERKQLCALGDAKKWCMGDAVEEWRETTFGKRTLIGVMTLRIADG